MHLKSLPIHKVFLSMTAVLSLVLMLLPSTAARSQQQSATPVWTPPAPRTKEKTLFAPRPNKGDSIFGGEAGRWLADAIIKLETDGVARIDDSFVTRYVAAVGAHLAVHSPAASKAYEFVVTDDEHVNAWTPGGGKIFINVGMLRAVENEDELAGVIAHEIGHDAFGHAPKTVTRQLLWMKGVRRARTQAEVEEVLAALLEEYEKKPVAAVAESLAGFRRFDELEADRAAFYMLYKAGYNPRALSSMLKRIERESKSEHSDMPASEQFIQLLFGSHPPTSQRATAISWESNLVKMPPKGDHHRSSAFDAMKARLR